ncbi:MAG: flagellar hook-length control protein FliK [Thiobacillaceae bacterium]
MTPVIDAISRIVPVQPVSESAQRWASSPAAFLDLDTLTAGQSVQARVLNHSQSETTVLIGTQPVRMELPVKVAVGDTLQLVFSGRNPRPVFLLAAIDHPPHVATHLSNTALLLGELTAQSRDSRAPASVNSPNPLLDEAPRSSVMLAVGLRSALITSGLFYESHLSDWVRGTYPLASLMQEPQAKPQETQAKPHEPQAKLHEPQAQLSSTDPPLRESLQDPNPERMSVDIRPTGEQPGATDLRPLIAQQLQLLENDRLIWRGEVWPGQAMQWEVAREHEGANPHASEPDSPAANWSTRITLELPRLGKITLNLRLDTRNNFDVRLSAQDEGTSALMESARREVMQDMQAAGCTIQSVSVEKNERA